jgi:hypothetical protein
MLLAWRTVLACSPARALQGKSYVRYVEHRRVEIRSRSRFSNRHAEQETGSLLEHVKADGFDIGRSNAEAVALLLSDLGHAKIFRIRILNRDAIGLLPHQAVETGRSSLDALRLAAGAILRVSACGGKQRQKKYQFTHASGGQSLLGFS